MFTSRSETLYDFFNMQGVAYYIPFYQRQYSWDVENVDKMMDDVYDGVRKLCAQGDYLRFLGPVILFPEPNPTVGMHIDTAGLLTKLFNVIDGQQRISTLAIIAILLTEKLEDIKKAISDRGWSSLPSVPELLTSIDNRLFELKEFYSNQFKKAHVNPERKPKIIRAYDMSASPKSDQWTLNGDYELFYKSDIARFIAHYIATNNVASDVENEKLRANMDAIRSWIDRTCKSADFPDAGTLVAQNSSNLKGFLDGDVETADIEHADEECAKVAGGAIKLLALIHFLTHKTYLTAIECPTEALAFDMFQSLNATGTPLTAIEVFKPLVVNTLGLGYGISFSKQYFDEIEAFFDQKKSAADKEKLTDEVLLRTALVHDGTELGKRFSEQRDWLGNAFDNCAGASEKEEFLRWLSNLTHYWEHVYQPRRPNRDTTHFKLVDHLVKMGVPSSEADLNALCIYYLKDANHTMAHYLIALFYAKALRADKSVIPNTAAGDFVRICKACAAFYTLWGGALTGFPDDVYRDLFRQNRANLSWASGASNQTPAFVIAHFREALEKKGVFDCGNSTSAKAKWKGKAVGSLGYGKQKLCKFGLFLAAHDKSPDNTAGKEGLVERGTSGSARYLTCEKWYSSEYEVIEHVGNRDKPTAPYKYSPPDSAVYPGNYSVVDMIGNLTLWSRNANSSTYAEWPDKAFYYGTLTSLTPTQSVDLTKLKAAFGITSVPPSLSTISASSAYIAHLAPLAARGEKGLPWDKQFIDLRTERMCDLIFDELLPWLS